MKEQNKSSAPSISQLVEPFRSTAFDSANNILTAEEEDELLYGDNIELNTVDSVFTADMENPTEDGAEVWQARCLDNTVVIIMFCGNQPRFFCRAYYRQGRL